MPAQFETAMSMSMMACRGSTVHISFHVYRRDDDCSGSQPMETTLGRAAAISLPWFFCRVARHIISSPLAAQGKSDKGGRANEADVSLLAPLKRPVVASYRA
ncbi:predicted protein [Plenodomus lingam JN3]|uniref:Predicted protein n=1 Tax=Leptosphaeria maculans (strain JN3 / isolate v23.1.3 / race Av1-4-5-6-7-8) TaxID=985895 RepID=E5ACM1_LEPMJ|nr:predicted protein [Plenodomus lingam JN3]CBY02223.1 predicted protein [Plenodomus lingam JN3]